MVPSCAVPITFAHRGARLVAPENTLEAFRRALEQGAVGLETDAHLSLDGEVVLVHDATLRRGWRRVRVRETPAAELAALSVPRLTDLYETLGAEYELSIDLKASGVGPKIVDVARQAGVPSRVWLCDPDVDVLQELRGRAPDVHLVHSTWRRAIARPLERHAADLADARIDALNLHHTEWTPGLVALFQRFGVRAFAWDVQEARQLRAMMTAGVDALYCDRVERMVAIAEEFDAS